jgi:hypothetical protein
MSTFIRLDFGREPKLETSSSYVEIWDSKIVELAHVPFDGNCLDKSLKSHE